MPPMQLKLMNCHCLNSVMFAQGGGGLGGWLGGGGLGSGGLGGGGGLGCSGSGGGGGEGDGEGADDDGDSGRGEGVPAGGEGGGGEGEGSSTPPARRIGSHCGGLAPPRMRSRVFELGGKTARVFIVLGGP